MTQDKKPTQEMDCSAANSDAVRRVVEVLKKESAAILRTAERVNTSIEEGVEHLLQCRGRGDRVGDGEDGLHCEEKLLQPFAVPARRLFSFILVKRSMEISELLRKLMCFLHSQNSGETREVIGTIASYGSTWNSNDRIDG